MPDPWADYVEAMRKLEMAVKLTAYHTRQAAEHTRETVAYTLLTVYHVREYTKRRKLSDARTLDTMR